MISENIEQVRARITSAAERSGSNPEQITLCVVTKTQPLDSVHAVVEAGILDIGENYYQELRDKWDRFPPEVRWHFIGGLQSNKAKYLVGRCATIQSMDSISLAVEINKRAQNAGVVQSVLIEVQLGDGESRAGAGLSEASRLIEQVMELRAVHLKGLMAVAPIAERPDIVRGPFRDMKRMFDGLPLENRKILSMGMTSDFEIAIEEGSNFVRIGTAIFGPRRVK